MGKDIEKNRSRDPQKTIAVKWVASKWHVTNAYVYDIINGKYDGGEADNIRRAYRQKYEELKAILS